MTVSTVAAPMSLADGPEPDAMTRDTVLGGRVRLCQPRNGYRVALDPVLLAAAVPAKEGQTVLDLGTGIGAAALCLAARVPGALITGLDSDPAVLALARVNVQENGLAARMRLIDGDVGRPSPPPDAAGFDHVVANPPYLKAGTATVSQHAGKARATAEGETALTDWIRAAHYWLKPGGRLTIIHRADRLDELLALMAGRFGSVTVFPVWPKAGIAARRVIVAGRQGSRAPARLLSGLVMHGPDGEYSADARRVLFDAAALRFD